MTGELPGAAVPRSASPPTLRRAVYRRLLAWAFTLFNSLRVISYLPTLAMIWRSGESDQHSLWTWVTWLGANLTMAAWLHEQNRGRWSFAAVVSVGNASMCCAMVVLIVWFRL